MSANIEVFISYSHDSQEHELRVLTLADRLRAEGIDAIIDQYQIAPTEGWQIWMEKQIRNAKFVLVVCTEIYLKRVMKEEMPGKGLGVMWESTIIYSYLYESGVINEKFIPIFFLDNDKQFIPRPLHSMTYYDVSNETEYDLLCRRLTDQPTTPAGPLGSRRRLPPLARASTASHSTGTLPPNLVHPYAMQANFTGREHERRELSVWLNDGAHSIYEIVAIGGMGKSALTWYWLTHDVLSDTDIKLDGIMWWSFYEGESSFTRFVDDALRYVNRQHIDTDELPTTYDRAQELRKQIQSKRMLFVFDGFERQLRDYRHVDDAYEAEVADTSRKGARACVDPIAARMLRDVAAGATISKVLLTSRLPVSDLEDQVGAPLAGVKRQNLHQLQLDHSVAFMRAQGVTKGTYAEIANACNAYGCHPLSLRLLSGLIARDPRMPGDISVAPQHDVHDNLVQRQHHVLENSYNVLPKRERALISRIAAFRSSVTYEAVAIFNTLGSKKRFDEAIRDLSERGILQRDLKHNRYDLHPVVRRYCYDRLTNKTQVHHRLCDYFADIPTPDASKVKTVQDLVPLMELYHHKVRAGEYDDAARLFHDRLHHSLYYFLGAYQIQIDLLRGLFPDGENHPPRLKEEDARALMLNALANSYSLSGQPRRAIALYEYNLVIRETQGTKLKIAAALNSMSAAGYLVLGELFAAEQYLRRSIGLCQEALPDYPDGIAQQWEAIAHLTLMLVLAHRGKFEEAVHEWNIVSSRAQQTEHLLAGAWSFRTILAVLMGDRLSAFEAVQMARTLALKDELQIDIVRTDWLLGVTLTMEGRDLDSAASHLSDALTRCRRINLIELEPDILLAWGRWYRATGNPSEARLHAEAASEIANRCEYRLKQAEIYNFLTQLALDVGAKETALRHAETAKERAWCDGPPYCYKPALDEREAMLKQFVRD